MGAFGNPGNYGTPYLAMDDEGKPYYALATDTFKDFVTFMHGLVEDGLADPELYTQDWAALVAKGNAGIVGSTFSWVTEPEIVVGDYKDEYAPVGPLTGPKGTMSYVYNGSRSADGGSAYAITSAMEYPEIAMRWINEMYDPLFTLQLNEGPIGVAIEIVNGNQIRRLPLAEGETYASRKNSTSLGGSAMFVWRDFYDWEPSPETAAMTEIREMIEPALPVDNNWPALFLSPEEQEQVQGLNDNIKPLSERRWAEWVMDGGVEEEWDDYVEQLYDLGLQDYLDAYYEFKVKRFGE
jgi:putative aldouronate transport system substrate-binding protein